MLKINSEFQILKKNLEVLRMHPATPVLDRICNRSVRFPEQQIQIEEGTSIMVPIYGLHYDPQYFPDPERFDPERFSDENKSKIKPFTYLPFGEGPRNCIGKNNYCKLYVFINYVFLTLAGKRFALIELKLGLAKIISQHEFLVCEKTNVKLPFEYKKASMTLQPEGGFWLNVKPISADKNN